MADQHTPGLQSAVGVLRQFARRPRNVERCELCSIEVASEHPHLIDPASRKLVCACPACALLFSDRMDAKYKRVPRDVRILAGFQMTDAQWDDLMIPINMAFFFHSSPAGKMIAMYPSPAGSTESLLSLEAWQEIVRENPQLSDMQADVEALLVNRIGHARGFSESESYIVPIDECYKLVGLIRMNWKGFSGGADVWQEIAHFFAQLKARAVVTPKVSHA